MPYAPADAHVSFTLHLDHHPGAYVVATQILEEQIVQKVFREGLTRPPTRPR